MGVGVGVGSLGGSHEFMPRCEMLEHAWIVALGLRHRTERHINVGEIRSHPLVPGVQLQFLRQNVSGFEVLRPAFLQLFQIAKRIRHGTVGESRSRGCGRVANLLRFAQHKARVVQRLVIPTHAKVLLAATLPRLHQAELAGGQVRLSIAGLLDQQQGFAEQIQRFLWQSARG